MASWVAVSSVLGPLIARLYDLAGVRSIAIDSWVEVGALLGGTWVALRWVDRREWREVGLDAPAASPGLLGEGFSLGCLAIGVPTLLLVAGGWLTKSPGSGEAGRPVVAWLAASIRISALLVPAAFAEEGSWRGDTSSPWSAMCPIGAGRWS